MTAAGCPPRAPNVFVVVAAAAVHGGVVPPQRPPLKVVRPHRHKGRHGNHERPQCALEGPGGHLGRRDGAEAGGDRRGQRENNCAAALDSIARGVLSRISVR